MRRRVYLPWERSTLCAEGCTYHGRRDGLCAEGCTHHGRREKHIPGYYLPTMVPYVHPWVYTTLYTPGYTSMPLYSLCWPLHVHRWHDAQRRGPGLNTEINNSKERKRASQEPKGVRVRGGCCAELLRLSRNNNMKDWIDEGSLPVYSLWFGHVAHSGLLSPVHPIVGVYAQSAFPPATRFTVG